MYSYTKQLYSELDIREATDKLHMLPGVRKLHAGAHPRHSLLTHPSSRSGGETWEWLQLVEAGVQHRKQLPPRLLPAGHIAGTTQHEHHGLLTPPSPTAASVMASNPPQKLPGMTVRLSSPGTDAPWQRHEHSQGGGGGGDVFTHPV